MANSDISLGARKPEPTVHAVRFEVNFFEVPEPQGDGIAVHSEAAQSEYLNGQLAAGMGGKLGLPDAVLIEILARPDRPCKLTVRVTTNEEVRLV